MPTGRQDGGAQPQTRKRRSARSTSPKPGTQADLERIRYALDQAAIVAATDRQGRITYVNDKFCEISKYARKELLGQNHRIVNSGYHRPEFFQHLWRTIASGTMWRGEIRNRAKDGSVYWVDTTIVPLLDAHGKPRQYLAIRYDITERRLREHREREQATLLSLGEMAAVVAHEVRNPLAGIRGAVQLLGSMTPGSVEGREFVDQIIARIDSLNAVIGDLLTFARLRSPKMASVDLPSLLVDIVGSLRHDPAIAGSTWDVATPDGLSIEGDVDQLRLVFTNIALNAAQATHGSRVRITATAADGHCVVSIFDSGPGLSEDLAERVFEPFFTTKHRGTGLGLPTARRIVESHAGSLELVNDPSGGAVARVVLPMAQRH